MTIESIERAAATAWPPIERSSAGAWSLSAGDGFSRRRNSAVPFGPVPDDFEARVEDVEAWFRARGLSTLFRVTPLCDPEVDGMLADRGFEFEAPTWVMTKRLDGRTEITGVDHAPTVTDDWIDIELGALGLDRSLVEPWLAAIRSVPSPASFATAMDGPRAVGVGLGVVVDDLVGVFEIAVRPEDRRRGHAGRITAALEAFGLQSGAAAAYLQVLDGDMPAIALYESLGYEPSHRYWYRRARSEYR